MAIRYVKDFEFPSAAGYTDSAPSKVTGQMFAKGGKVEKAPKGLMVIIGVGKPKGEVKKSRGGPEYIDKGPDTSVPVKGMKGTKNQSTDEDFYGKAKDMPMPTRRPATMKKGGYAEGGMKAEQGVALPDMSPEKEMFEVYDRQSGDVVGTYGSLKSASRAVDRRDNDYGGYRYGHRPVSKAKGGMAHDDAAQDKAMIKSMIKPSALKKAGGGMAQKVQMAKSNAVEESLKGQKKTPYAEGGSAARPFGSGARQTAPSVSSTQYKADGGMSLAAPRIASPLQAMAARPRSVPVAPRAPMIPQQAAMATRGAMMDSAQAAPAGGPRIGIGQARPGQANVGAIRAAMARKASQAMPENSPGMMKKGGKVNC